MTIQPTSSLLQAITKSAHTAAQRPVPPGPDPVRPTAPARPAEASAGASKARAADPAELARAQDAARLPKADQTPPAPRPDLPRGSIIDILA